MYHLASLVLPDLFCIRRNRIYNTNRKHPAAMLGKLSLPSLLKSACKRTKFCIRIAPKRIFCSVRTFGSAEPLRSASDRFQIQRAKNDTMAEPSSPPPYHQCHGLMLLSQLASPSLKALREEIASQPNGQTDDTKPIEVSQRSRCDRVT
jgi:hypothetical protein